jgi:tricorn protease
VVPIDTEADLRNLAWIEENRRKVDKLSGGRVAYVYMPDTALGGYASFNRYFFAQTGKQAVVLDERFNGGGMLADYVIDYLRREKLNYGTQRDGQDFTTPNGGIYGPKVMIVNEYAGSGGDAMPYYFRRAHIGALIGKRTRGGLVRGDSAPPLIDGGSVAAPGAAIWSADGEEWVAENKGVRPDVEVEQDPAAVRAGHDPQLEKAVEVILAALQKDPPRPVKHPPFTRQKRGPGL